MLRFLITGSDWSRGEGFVLGGVLVRGYSGWVMNGLVLVLGS
jgi:hypothetical protein